MLRLGTSGYSYEDWSGIFYPANMDKAQYLNHYSNFFLISEINSTYYHIPEPDMFSAMLEKVPPDFDFIVKLPNQFTHNRHKMADSIDTFKQAIRPLTGPNRLKTLLAQFPYSFKPSEKNYNHLSRIRKAFPEVPINVEFRNKFWIKDATFSFLRKHKLGYVCVDMPSLSNLVPPVARAPTDISYVRFHGRVKKHWWNPPERHMRYDYLYSKQELQPWVSKIEQLDDHTKETFILFNNHFSAKSAKNAVMLADLMELSPPEINFNPEEVDFLQDATGSLF